MSGNKLTFSKRWPGIFAMAIVVAAGGHVTHRVIETEEQCAPAALLQAANYINAEFSGMTLQEARAAIVRSQHRNTA